uniref:Uncharacterized protein n=1 Tax=Arundo donax TaxID=35708 RepID=A0A0A8Y9Y0_ARUDO
MILGKENSRMVTIYSKGQIFVKIIARRLVTMLFHIFKT